MPYLTISAEEMSNGIACIFTYMQLLHRFSGMYIPVFTWNWIAISMKSCKNEIVVSNNPFLISHYYTHWYWMPGNIRKWQTKIHWKYLRILAYASIFISQLIFVNVIIRNIGLVSLKTSRIDWKWVLIAYRGYSECIT